MAHEGQGYDIKGGLETRERRKEDHCDDDMSPRFSFLTLTLILPPPVVSCLFVMSVVTCFDQPDMERVRAGSGEARRTRKKWKRRSRTGGGRKRRWRRSVDQAKWRRHGVFLAQRVIRTPLRLSDRSGQRGNERVFGGRTRGCLGGKGESD